MARASRWENAAQIPLRRATQQHDQQQHEQQHLQQQPEDEVGQKALEVLDGGGEGGEGEGGFGSPLLALVTLAGLAVLLGGGYYFREDIKGGVGWGAARARTVNSACTGGRAWR